MIWRAMFSSPYPAAAALAGVRLMLVFASGAGALTRVLELEAGLPAARVLRRWLDLRPGAYTRPLFDSR